MDNSRVIPLWQNKPDYYRQALAMLDQDQLTEALGLFALAYEEDPTDELCLNDYAQSLYMVGSYMQSVQVLVLYEHYTPQPMLEAYFALACNYAGMDNYYGAQNFLNQFIQLGPDADYAEAVEDMQQICAQMGQAQQLNATTRQWMRQAEQAMQAQDPDRAVALLRQALAAQNQNILIRNRLILLLMQLEDYPQAARVAQQTAEQNPQDVSCRVYLAYIHHTLGDTHRSHVWQRSACSLAAGQTDDERLQCVRLVCQLQGPQQAWRQACQFELNLAYSPAVLHEMALLAIQAGQPQAAVALYDRIRAINPLDVQAGLLARWAVTPQAAQQAPDMPGEYCLPDHLRTQLQHDIARELQPLPQAIDAWQCHAAFRERVRWALVHAEDACFELAALLLAAAADNRAVFALRQALATPGISQKRSRQIIGCLHKMGHRGPYVIFADGMWLVLSQHAPARMVHRPRKGDVYREARQQALEAAVGRWGQPGKAGVAALYRALLLGMRWPAPALQDSQGLTRGLLAAAAVMLQDFAMHHTLVENSPPAQYWCKEILLAYRRYDNLDLLV